jgi:hypothetical protein
MFGFSFRRRKSRKRCQRSKLLRIEALEDRRMLVAADIVFLVDASRTLDTSPTREWLDSIVDELDGTLRSAVDNIDARYGVVAFGQQLLDGTHRAAHSQVVDLNATSGTVFERLWSDSDHAIDLQAAIGNIVALGGG